MSYSIYKSIAANNYADPSNVANSFSIFFSDAAPDTATTLRFTQTANQTLNFPDTSSFGGNETLIVTGASLVSPLPLQNASFTSSTITSLTASLPVASGGMGNGSVTASQLLIGNNTSFGILSLASGQTAIGTGASPVSANITGSSTYKVTSASGSITINAGIIPLVTKVSTGDVINSNGSFTNMLAIPLASYVAGPNVTVNTGAGTCTIAANTLKSGDTIYINVIGNVQNNTGASRSITLRLTMGGSTIFTSAAIPIINPSVGVTLALNLEVYISINSGSPSNVIGYITGRVYGSATLANNTTTATNVIYQAPTVATLNLASAQTISLDGRVSNGNVKIAPEILNMYVIRGSL